MAGGKFISGLCYLFSSGPMKLNQNMKEIVIYAVYDIKSEMVKVYDAPNDTIEEAIETMTQEYDKLAIYGYMDGHHFCITAIYNETGDYYLNEREINEMYYRAFGPECITLRIE